MKIGIPKEIKTNERRVGYSPACVREFSKSGHIVNVETGAGEGIGASDEMYLQAGAKICATAADVFATSEMIVKVKEPQPDECAMLREGQVLFTYLHLAPAPELTELLLRSGCIAIAYETISDESGGLPLLAPMSEVAGRMSVQAGAHALEALNGGSGTLLSGVPGVRPAQVLVIGGGVAGANAARIASGMGADVTVLEKSIVRMRQLDVQFASSIKVEYASAEALDRLIETADLVIGAVLVPGDLAPKLITRPMLRRMKVGAVIVDIAIDQGGCVETSRPTTLDKPTFVEEGVVHYCVANMPGAVPRTSSQSLNIATLPVCLTLAGKGVERSLSENPHLRKGLNVHTGKLTCEAVARAQNRPYVPAVQVLTPADEVA